MAANENPVFSNGVPSHAHGDDALHSRVHQHARSDSDFEQPGTKVKTEDAHNNELGGANFEQDRVDSYRAAHQADFSSMDLGHPQDRGMTRADAYAHSIRDSGGAKSFKRGGQSGGANR